MKITYDSEADAMVIYLGEGKAVRHQLIHSLTRPRMVIGFDENNNPVDLELLYVSQYISDPKQVNLVDLVRQITTTTQ